MAHVKIWVHAVWATKNREPSLKPELKKIITDHIKKNALKKKIRIDIIDGYLDHLHCLFLLRADMAVADAMKLIKGESSFWVNKNKLMESDFEWQDEYYAISVSESDVEKVRAYIRNQEIHHRYYRDDTFPELRSEERS